MPQSSGNRTGVEKFTLSGSGSKLSMQSSNPIEFSLLPYNDDELGKALHWHELPESENWYLYTDVIQRGVGTRSCGPELNNRYRVQPGEYKMTLSIS